MLLENPIQTSHLIIDRDVKSLGVISGTVIDGKTKSVLTGAKVHIWNSTSRSIVETDGKFELEIPDYHQADVVIIEVSNKNYDSKIISYKIKNIPEFLSIELNKKSKSKNHSSGRKGWRLFGWSIFTL